MLPNFSALTMTKVIIISDISIYNNKNNRCNNNHNHNFNDLMVMRMTMRTRNYKNLQLQEQGFNYKDDSYNYIDYK